MQICVFAVKGKSYALKKLRNSLNVLKLVQELDDKALVQLLAPMSSDCQFVLMLYALVNGNAELVRKYARFLCFSVIGWYFWG